MKLGWAWVGVWALALAGCDASIERCTDRDDAGHCVFFDDFPDLDAGGESDAGAGDAGAVADAAGMDSGVDAGITLADASIDASQPLTAAAFCDLQLARARAWLDFFESSCDCASQSEHGDREYFLAVALLYGDSSGADCIDFALDLQQRSSISYDGRSAAGCATRFAEQFAAPPTSCSDGFELDRSESMIGHGIQQLAQLPECRATFAGKLGPSAACTNSFECGSGLRCLPVVGGTTADGGVAMSCQPARAALETCTNRSDCADGLICARSDSSATGATCIPVNELRTVNGPCRASRECEPGLVCDCATADCSTGTCITAPASSPICKP